MKNKPMANIKLPDRLQTMIGHFQLKGASQYPCMMYKPVEKRCDVRLPVKQYEFQGSYLFPQRLIWKLGAWLLEKTKATYIHQQVKIDSVSIDGLKVADKLRTLKSHLEFINPKDVNLLICGPDFYSDLMRDADLWNSMVFHVEAPCYGKDGSDIFNPPKEYTKIGFLNMRVVCLPQMRGYILCSSEDLR